MVGNSPNISFKIIKFVQRSLPDSAANNRHFVVIVNECYWPQIMLPVLHLCKHVRHAPTVYDPGAQIKAKYPEVG